MLEQNGILCPVEVKKTAPPSKKDARNLCVLDPVAVDDVPADLLAFKREIGRGRIPLHGGRHVPGERARLGIPGLCGVARNLLTTFFGRKKLLEGFALF